MYRNRRWMFFFSCRNLSELLEYAGITILWIAFLQHVQYGNYIFWFSFSSKRKEKKASISSVFNSRLDVYTVIKINVRDDKEQRMVSKNKIKFFDRQLEGSLTVEASVVMVVVLWSILILLMNGFKIHQEVVGKMVLQEAIERAVHGEKDLKPDFIEEQAIHDLKTYFGCQTQTLYLKEKGNSVEGTLQPDEEIRIQVKKFKPEKFIRRICVFKNLNMKGGREKRGGDKL